MTALLLAAVLASGPAAPSARIDDLAHLLRSCLHCHSVRGPSTPMFDSKGRMLKDFPDSSWDMGIRAVLNNWRGTRPTDPASVRDLERALAILEERKKLPR